ncbi:hypothetical protein LTS18_003043 [Coniosporium uncinatum]|uniref:Uncharacterized protein n=1 Tax=Coniosporium uncinatum TaxID=93489 RepID=A0ACC3DBK2_9PEZI|nr:hypothetical protein LTS18_003043 [Coniosporium uncinatum]
MLGLQVESFYKPGCMIISSKEMIVPPLQVHIVQCTEWLNLAKLYDTHAVYEDVIHKKTMIEEATARLDNIKTQSDKFPPQIRIVMCGLASAYIGPVSYGARAIDLPSIFL